MITIREAIQIKRETGTADQEMRDYVYLYICNATLVPGTSTIEIDRELQELFPAEWAAAQDAIR